MGTVVLPSVQGVLPPSPPYNQNAGDPMAQVYHNDDSRQQPVTEANSNATAASTATALNNQQGMQYGAWPGHSSPPAVPYQLYHIAAYHQGNNIDRAASPPPPPVHSFPSGGSPPLSPGFISIPIQHMEPHNQHSSHPPILYAAPGSSPPHSLGSSPPGYYYMHPHHAPHYNADFASHMAGLSLGSSPPGSTGMSVSQSSSPGPMGSSRASARIARSNRAGGQYNPSDFSFAMEEAESGSPTARTTIMIRNIPNKYNQAVFASMLDKAGFKGTFDFFYLPVDFRNRCGLGYAFVNFISPVTTAQLYKQFHGKRWDEQSSKKVCEITYARIQGRDNLVQHFRTAKFPSDDSAYQPLVFSTIFVDDEGEKREMAVHPMPIHAYLKCVAEEADEQGEE